MEIRRLNFLWWNNGIKLISMENRRLNFLWWNNGIKWLSMEIRRLNFYFYFILWWNNGIKWLCMEFWMLIFVWWNNGVKWLCVESLRVIFYGKIMEIRGCTKGVILRAIEVVAPLEKTPHSHPYGPFMHISTGTILRDLHNLHTLTLHQTFWWNLEGNRTMERRWQLAATLRMSRDFLLEHVA